jgi:RNA polymerase sigma-70 factor (ECF subfamily)
MTGNGVPIAGSHARSDESDDARLVAALQNGDERAFVSVVDRFHPALIRYAVAHVSDRSVAEDIVQETWLALVRGVERFEGRSSLKTWLFRVLTYQARQRVSHTHRSTPFSDLDEPSVDPARFTPHDHRSPGHWIDDLASFEDTPEEFFLRQETMSHVRDLIAALPTRQRVVLVLRDVEGLSADEACEVLGMNDGTMRVLLHRARARIRQGIESYLRDCGE